MAANSFGRQLAEMIFSSSRRPGKYLLSYMKHKLDKEFEHIYQEQMLYQGCFLSKVSKFDPDSAPLEQIKSELSSISIEESKIMLNSEYLEKTFKILHSMHKLTRTIPIIFDPRRYSSSTEILDPNMFPIHTAKSKQETQELESIWQSFASDLNPKLISMIGHTLEIRPSSVPHPQAGNGVWLLSRNQEPVAAGSLIGFFPGIYYTKEMLGTKPIPIMPLTELPYLTRWNGDAINHTAHLFHPPYRVGQGCEELIEKFERLGQKMPVEVLPHNVNPYGLGHLINHPPPGTPPNVCFIDFQIPENFLPTFLLNHLPYMNQSVHPRDPPGKLNLVGVVAIGSLKHGEELFVNYGSERFPDGFTPDWLCDPPDNLPLAEYLCKDECVYEFSRLTQTLMKWDKITATEDERIMIELKEERERKIKEAMEDTELFAKYYNKKDD